jgi:hypothetical protein
MSEATPEMRRAPEEMEKAERLARIFNPQATRQRSAAFERQGVKPELGSYLRFAHYTTAEAGLKILQSKRLWMRNTTCMADFREVRHGYDLLLKYFNDTRTKAFIDTFEKNAPGAVVNAIREFNGWWGANNSLNIYVSSFSEHSAEDDLHGRLSMWRAFGSSASARVALIFRLPYGARASDALSVIFSPVAYLAEADAFKALDEVVRLAQEEHEFLSAQRPEDVQRMLFTMLYAGVTCLKHDGFKEEREWRAVYHPQIWHSPLMEIAVETIGGIPQHVHKMPLDVEKDPRLADLDPKAMLDGVIIGPSQYPYVIAQAFGEELSKLGVSNPYGRVRASEIPIRS